MGCGCGGHGHGHGKDGHNGQADRTEELRQILKERLARGEITREEYEEIQKVIDRD